ncbi:hypothetical protein CFELI_01060 [Corynebacterium felinum]|nr:hypothetical protein CFELI_01060 [Corynebacterium felinum]
MLYPRYVHASPSPMLCFLIFLRNIMNTSAVKDATIFALATTVAHLLNASLWVVVIGGVCTISALIRAKLFA